MVENHNPVLARFIQADTVVPDAKNLQAFNRYAYAANNPLKYIDPSGHGFWSWFKKLAGVFVGALISVLSFGLLMPAGATLASLSLTQAVVFGALSGMAGGLVGGAITVGINGMLMGALFGLVGGALTGGIGHGIAGITDKFVRGVVSGIMMGAGAGLSYVQGGWQGLVSFGVGLLGATAGSRLVGPLKSGLAKMREGPSGGASHQTLLDSVAADQVGGDVPYDGEEGPLSTPKDVGGGIGRGGGGDTVYRQGKFPNGAWDGNNIKGGQWAPENPLTTEGFAQKYGLPIENSGRPDWIVQGRTGSSGYTSGPAPKSYNNPINIGGATEIRPNNPNDVRMDWFHMP